MYRCRVRLSCRAEPFAGGHPHPCCQVPWGVCRGGLGCGTTILGGTAHKRGILENNPINSSLLNDRSKAAKGSRGSHRLHPGCNPVPILRDVPLHLQFPLPVDFVRAAGNAGDIVFGKKNRPPSCAAPTKTLAAFSAISMAARTDCQVPPIVMMPWFCIRITRGRRPCFLTNTSVSRRISCASFKPGSTSGMNTEASPQQTTSSGNIRRSASSRARGEHEIRFTAVAWLCPTKLMPGCETAQA